MAEGLTTIKVYRNDRQLLQRLFGQPTHVALHQALAGQCPHPESGRRYTTALVNAADAGQAITELDWDRRNVRTVSAFLCSACGKLIVPDPGTVE